MAGWNFAALVHSLFLQFRSYKFVLEETILREAILQGAIFKTLVRTIFMSLTLTAPALAERLVDPTHVAPEYRDAAETRRAEQIKQQQCARKADLQNVMPRERTAFLLQCIEADAQK